MSAAKTTRCIYCGWTEGHPPDCRAVDTEESGLCPADATRVPNTDDKRRASRFFEHETVLVFEAGEHVDALARAFASVRAEAREHGRNEGLAEARALCRPEARLDCLSTHHGFSETSRCDMVEGHDGNHYDQRTGTEWKDSKTRRERANPVITQTSEASSPATTEPSRDGSSFSPRAEAPKSPGSTSGEAPAIEGSREGDGPVRGGGTTPQTAAFSTPNACKTCLGLGTVQDRFEIGPGNRLDCPTCKPRGPETYCLVCGEDPGECDHKKPAPTPSVVDYARAVAVSYSKVCKYCGVLEGTAGPCGEEPHEHAWISDRRRAPTLDEVARATPSSGVTVTEAQWDAVTALVAAAIAMNKRYRRPIWGHSGFENDSAEHDMLDRALDHLDRVTPKGGLEHGR